MNIIGVKKEKEFATVFMLIAVMFSILLINFVITKDAYAGSHNKACKCVYTSNPIIYALYLKTRNRPISKKDIITYVKIVNPAKYMHDRYNTFLWSKLFSKDKLKLATLMDYINYIKCFKENINADISNYTMKKHGFYLTYSGINSIISNGMKTHRNINFIKTKNGRIYYLFHHLTIVHSNAGDFNFLNMPEKKAENFINKRTGTLGHIKKSVYLEYSFVPLAAKSGVLTVKILCVKVYNNKHENFLLGIVK